MPHCAVLGLTVLALGGGLRSLATNNKHQSQLMMRARVFFQFCTVSALVGGIYYRAYKGSLGSCRAHWGCRAVGAAGSMAAAPAGSPASCPAPPCSPRSHADGKRGPAIDDRVYLNDSRIFDITETVAAGATGGAASSPVAEPAPKLQ